MSNLNFDAVIVGGGSAGVAAAIACARHGSRTLLIEAGTSIGGDLISGLPMLGCLNSRGEWITGGVTRELLSACEELGGYIGPVFDWRTLWGVCFDPEAMRLSISRMLAEAGVTILLSSFACGVEMGEGGTVEAITVSGRGGPMSIRARQFVDCTGDADLVWLAGAETEKGAPARCPGGSFQPVSMVFQMAGIDVSAALEWVRGNSEQILLAENEIITKPQRECAEELARAGYPYFALSARGELLGGAIEHGEMYPCTAVFTTPISMARGEVAINSTRLAEIDATDARALSNAYLPLMNQIERCAKFLRKSLPGYGEASIIRIAPRIGVRETRRIVGEQELSTEAVAEGRKSIDGIAKGGHHIDIHGSGTYQKRIPVAGGKSYDIPYGCLIPRGLRNVLVAGRCISSTREANGSARVMGTCTSTGLAAGVAVSACQVRGVSDVRDLSIEDLREELKLAGAVLEGTA